MIRERKQCIVYHLLFSHTVNEFLVFDGNGTAAWYGNEGGQTQKVQNHRTSLTLYLKVDLIHTKTKMPFSKGRNE